MRQLLFSAFDNSRTWSIDPETSLWIGALYALLLMFVLVRARKNFLSLPELASCPPSPHSDCMVVIPARDEAAIIGRAVRSLPADTVLVVDDNSSDATAKEAEEAGAGVLRAPKLPRGAVGKQHACMIGAKAVQSRWILFADADTWFEDGLIESAIHAAQADNLAFLSIHLHFESESIAEHIITPYAHALFFSAVNPRKNPDEAFDGRCILVRRDAYEFIGGHAVSLSYLVDDVKLASLAQRHRMRLGLARTSELGHARLHYGFSGLWSGIERNAHRFTLLRATQGAAVLLTALVAALWLPMIIYLLISGQSIAAAVLGVLLLVLLGPWYGSFLTVFLAPFAVYAILPILINATLRVLGTVSVEWKGRRI
ncbi:MAG: glycosyltransferase family 2 protein [Acidobacteriota bacterium]